MFFERSRYTPLSISPGTISAHDCLQPKLFHLLDSAAHHIHSLQLRCLGLSLDTSISCTWDITLLGALDLLLDPPSASAGFAFLTGTALPNLKRLSLRSVHKNLFTLLIRSTLTQLVIDIIYERPTSMEWADLLEQLPLLEHLILKDAVNLSELFGHCRTPPPPKKISMSHLSSIKLSDTFQFMRLLEYLILSTLQTLTVSLDDIRHRHTDGGRP